VLVTADCHPSRDRSRWTEQRGLWLEHLERTYTHRKAESLLRDWSDEDTYVPLATELELLDGAGFTRRM
jgi:hypothetical protein